LALRCHSVDAAALTLTAVLAAVVAPLAQGTLRSAREGVYSTAQANRGKTLYETRCASCHGTMSSVTPDMAPLLNDHAFQTFWRERSLDRFFGRIRETMPQNEPGTLSPDETAEIVAYILSGNGLPAGEVPLPVDLEVLQQIRMDTGQP
jgi:mono/diheme cytochrome c family protein